MSGSGSRLRASPCPLSGTGRRSRLPCSSFSPARAPAERGKGLRSAIPRGSSLRSLAIARRVVTVDLGARFAAGGNEAALQDRVGQLVRTVRSMPGVLAVRVLVEGGVPIGLFPGYDLRRPITAPVDRATTLPTTTRVLQQRLVDLGFLAEIGRHRERRLPDRRPPSWGSRSGRTCRETDRSERRRFRHFYGPRARHRP